MVYRLNGRVVSRAEFLRNARGITSAAPAAKIGRGTHFDRGLLAWVKNDAERNEFLKRRGLVEVGNDRSVLPNGD